MRETFDNFCLGLHQILGRRSAGTVLIETHEYVTFLLLFCLKKFTLQ